VGKLIGDGRVARESAKGGGSVSRGGRLLLLQATHGGRRRPHQMYGGTARRSGVHGLMELID